MATGAERGTASTLSEPPSFTDISQALLEIIFSEARRIERLALVAKQLRDQEFLDIEALRERISRVGEARRILVDLAPHEPLVRAFRARAIEIQRVLSCTSGRRFSPIEEIEDLPPTIKS